MGGGGYLKENYTNVTIEIQGGVLSQIIISEQGGSHDLIVYTLNSLNINYFSFIDSVLITRGFYLLLEISVTDKVGRTDFT